MKAETLIFLIEFTCIAKKRRPYSKEDIKKMEILYLKIKELNRGVYVESNSNAGTCIGLFKENREQ